MITFPARRVAATLTALAAVALLLGACGDDSDTAASPSSSAPGSATAGIDDTTAIADPADPATASTTAPAYGDVNMADAASVARKAMEVWFTWDTTVETGPHAAVANTVPLLTADYADQLLTGAPQGGPGGTWLLWADKKAHTRVDVRDVATSGGTDAGPTQQVGDRAYFEYDVTQTPLGPTQQPVAAPLTNRVGVLCSRTDTGDWAVSAVQPL